MIKVMYILGNHHLESLEFTLYFQRGSIFLCFRFLAFIKKSLVNNDKLMEYDYSINIATVDVRIEENSPSIL